MVFGSLFKKPEELAEQLMAEGQFAKAAKLFAKAGQFDRAGKAAFKGHDETNGIRYVLQAALGRVDEIYLDSSGKQAGDYLFANGKYRHAKILYEQVREFKKAAEAALKLKQNGAAARYYEKAGLYAEAAIYYESVGRVDNALSMLEAESKKVKANPTLRSQKPTTQKSAYELDLRRANILEKVGRVDEAAGLLQEIGLPKKAAELLSNRGRFDRALDLYVEAESWSDAYALLEKHPKVDKELAAKISLNAGHVHHAARLFAAMGQTKSAAMAFEQAEDWNQAGLLWEKIREHSRAATAYQQLGEYQRAARCWTASGEFELAARNYSKVSNYRAAGENYLRSKQPYKAAEHFLKCKDKLAAQTALLQVPVDHDSFTSATILLAPLLLEASQYQAAYQRLQLLSADTREMPERAYFEARALEGLGKDSDAEHRYETLLTQKRRYKDAGQRLQGLKSKRQSNAIEATEVVSPFSQIKSSTELIEVGGVLAGRYQIVGVIGQGGMGKVYKAYDRQLNVTIAIKTLLQAADGRNSVEEERLLQEVRICHRITHPNVVRVYDVGRYAKGLFVSMEFLEGQGLETLVKADPPLELPKIRWILAQLIEGLKEAHHLGVIHRDLKPANVMVTKDRVKILDFGIARARDFDAQLTQTGFAVGSPRYMSPEQFQGEEVDARSDLYATGIIAFALIAGTEPFKGANITRLVLDHLGSPPPDLRALRPGISEAWVGFVEKLLEKEKKDRYQSAEEVAEALRGLD